MIVTKRATATLKDSQLLAATYYSTDSAASSATNVLLWSKRVAGGLAITRKLTQYATPRDAL